MQHPSEGIEASKARSAEAPRGWMADRDCNAIDPIAKRLPNCRSPHLREAKKEKLRYQIRNKK